MFKFVVLDNTFVTLFKYCIYVYLVIRISQEKEYQIIFELKLYLCDSLNEILHTRWNVGQYLTVIIYSQL